MHSIISRVMFLISVVLTKDREGKKGKIHLKGKDNINLLAGIKLKQNTKGATKIVQSTYNIFYQVGGEKLNI